MYADGLSFLDEERDAFRPFEALLELTDEQLFREQWVRVNLEAAELPGNKGERFICPQCGEGVNFGRFVEVEGRRLCLSCARPELRYWETDDSGQ